MSTPISRGDPRHPEHDAFLTELGRAVYAAAYLAQQMVDLLRVHYGVDFWDLSRKTHGQLKNALDDLSKADPTKVPGMAAEIGTLVAAVDARNHIMHALVARDGLERRDPKDKSVLNYFDAPDFTASVELMKEAARKANALLYHDGGAAVRAYK